MNDTLATGTGKTFIAFRIASGNELNLYSLTMNQIIALREHSFDGEVVSEFDQIDEDAETEQCLTVFVWKFN